MPIEIREYESYLSEMNPTVIEKVLTPFFLNMRSGYQMIGSVDHWCVENNLLKPTVFATP